MKLIEIYNADFSYDRDAILNNISLTLEKGQVLCLLGPNGCGKTTLLDCMIGLNKIESGSIIINGKSIMKLKSCEMAQNIAYVPQRHRITFPYKVIDIVLMGRTPYTNIFSSPSQEDYNIAEEALDLLDMRAFKDRIYTQLSGGEAQLVMLARALAQQTPIIIMDEPTSHLDFKHELMILESVESLIKKRNVSIIMATHFPNHAFYFENHDIPTWVAMMNKGRIAVYGKPSEILNEENMKDVFDVNAMILCHRDDKNKDLNYIIPLKTNSKKGEKII